MTSKKIFALVIGAALATSVCGCTGQMVQTTSGPLPDYCLANPTATGTALGAIGGAALGYALGGWQGAIAGGALGAGTGGLTGAQMEMNCRQLAMNNFMQMMAQQAVQQATMAQGQEISPAAYATVDYYTPATQTEGAPRRHRFTQTSAYTDPRTREHCGSYSEINFDANNTGTITGTGRICTGADGKPHTA